MGDEDEDAWNSAAVIVAAVVVIVVPFSSYQRRSSLARELVHMRRTGSYGTPSHR